jgi:hypothetical protein
MGHSNCDKCGYDTKMCDCPKDEVTTEYLNDRSGSFVCQEGGNHYQAEYQHWDWVQETGIGYLVGNATKYLSRWHKKNGVQDLVKAKTYLEKIIATRHLPGADWHYREASYRTRVLTEKFIKCNQIQQAEEEIIWNLSGTCPVEIVKLALDRLDVLIKNAQKAAGGRGGAGAV